MKKRLLIVIIVILFASGALGTVGIYYVHSSKYIKFQDEAIKAEILESLDGKEDKVLKTQESEVKVLYVDELFRNISTLDDLKMFPELSKLGFMWDTYYETEKERNDFEEKWKVTEEEYERYQEMLRKTLPELKNLKKIQIGSYNVFYDLNSFKECAQIEELRIQKKQIVNIEGLKGMENLKIIDLSYNKFKDISILKELKNLEAININKTPIDNLEVLLDCSSLRLVCYTAKDEVEESVLKALEEKGVTVVKEEWEYVAQYRSTYPYLCE